MIEKLDFRLIYISLSILDKPLSNCGTYASKLNLLSFESLTGKLKKIIPQRVVANIKATYFETIQPSLGLWFLFGKIA